jgi:PleD family two-component response regulator
MALEFEKNRKDLLDTIEQMRHKAKTDEERGKVLVFGERCAFVDGLIQTIEKKHRTRFFSNPDDACAYCLKYGTKVVIMDMDPPTDWKMSTDVFTTVRTSMPGVTVIICTKTPNEVHIQTLAAQNAVVLAIPFSSDILFRVIKGGL